ncbi:MAG: beta,4-mannosyltransferase [Frankiaceae bacterium]|nr:beta,4-mannosyltransferase [Frankiaceae bacterium]
MTTPGRGTRRLRVVQSFRTPRSTTNPYLTQLADALAHDVDVAFFSWRTALGGRYDVLHLHWPEILLRGNSRLGTAARRVLAAVLLLRLWAVPAAVVRTQHNVGPHDPPGRVDALLLGCLERRTDAWIRLNRWTPTPDATRTTTVPHGHYGDRYADAIASEAAFKTAPEPGRLLHFGIVRRYKGVVELAAAFAGVPDASLRLRIAGRVHETDLTPALESAAAADPRVMLALHHLDDDALVAEIKAAELVVLPYREMHNSGAALLALTLGRPVLVPANEVTAELSDEVGPGWVLTYRAPLDAAGLRRAVDAVRTGPRSVCPVLHRRNWDVVAAAHLEVYAAAVARRAVRSGSRWRAPGRR